jgi:hypothetical protein
MEVFLVVVGALIVLTLIWAVIYDRRHRADPLTGNNPGAQARTLRIEGEQKGAEGGGRL